jgi:hypothetical protein
MRCDMAPTNSTTHFPIEHWDENVPLLTFTECLIFMKINGNMYRVAMIHLILKYCYGEYIP